jgi:hypothetical protein
MRNAGPFPSFLIPKGREGAHFGSMGAWVKATGWGAQYKQRRAGEEARSAVQPGTQQPTISRIKLALKTEMVIGRAGCGQRSPPAP